MGNKRNICRNSNIISNRNQTCIYFLIKSNHIDPSFFATTITVFKRILISNPISQFSIYSLSSLTTSSKSVISLRPLTCHIPVIPGLIASLALCRGSYKFVSEINGGLVPTMDISPPYVNSGTTFFQKYLIKHSIINLPSK